ncbi:Bipolar DNA helicase [Caenispirillum salinarum AK4]|uniref:Bipolar DNA helicase n=1 Tax=Caenispirillum salinarum AK4 TaxID=1238182 RepID=K9GTF2_9PROT|nr:ATP-binding protein [Caenispirillum salinarum]EKV28044.1 Bipolar DNA helicase [Caenispirillum salinarum AK4]
MDLFRLNDDDAFGSVLNVDSGSVTVQVFDPQSLRKLQVQRPVLLHGRPGRALIGMIKRITRKAEPVKATADEADEDGAEQEAISVDAVEIALIGTLHARSGGRRPQFKRALEAVPEIDSLCFSLDGDRLSIFMKAVSEVSEEMGHPLSLGCYALDPSATAYLNGDRLFQRHVGIVGSTGSGKSWTTARLLEQMAALPNANAIVFDVHGEYGTLTGDGFRHLRIAGPGDLDAPGDNVLFLPHWLLGADALRALLVDRSDQIAPNQTMLLRRFVREAKEDFLGAVGDEDLLKAFTVDSPIPFRLQILIRKLTDLNEEMVDGANGKPKQGDYHGKLSRMIARLEARAEDRRLGFLFPEGEDDDLTLESLGELAVRLMAGRCDQPDGKGGVKIIDFSEVPSDVLPLIVSMVAGLAFSIQQWTPSQRRHPVALVCDEAHNYIPDQASEDSEGRVAVRMFERIAKEGRKYGLGLAVISQRPAEVSRTVISQCNNIIAMRLTNPEDQSRVRALLPDTLSGFTDFLPTLDTGEAVVVGDASLLPSRVRIAPPRSKPDSRTFDFWQRWSAAEEIGGLTQAVDAWRRQSLQPAKVDPV